MWNLAVLLAFCLGSSQHVLGGVCWAKRSRNGKCREIVQSYVSRETCCRITGGLGSFTEKDYDSGELFYWNALAGGAPKCEPCSTSCENVKCREEEICSVKNGQAQCGCVTLAHCNSQMTNLTSPVCAVHGVSFRSLCHLQRHNCQRQTHHWVDYEGPCMGSCETVKCKADQHCVEDTEHMPHCIRCSASCPNVKSLVCGSDGKTYDSICHLNQLTCKNPDSTVNYAYRGPCRDKPACADIQCTPSETCLLEQDSKKPRCVRCDLECDRTEQPVCGSDGVTYTNWCEMRRNACASGVLIHAVKMGACQENEAGIDR